MRYIFTSNVFLRYLCVSIALLMTTAVIRQQADAGRHTCARCQSVDSCCKICKLVKDEKKVPIICWGYECEDFCLPCPSTPACEHCETVDCRDPKKPEICSKSKLFIWTEWCAPTAAFSMSKKKLMKKVVTKKIPSYKWVVEDLCQTCRDSTFPIPVASGDSVPSPPKEVVRAGIELVGAAEDLATIR